MNLRLLILVAIFGFAAVAVGWVYERSLRAPEEKADLVIQTGIPVQTNLDWVTLSGK